MHFCPCLDVLPLYLVYFALDNGTFVLENYISLSVGTMDIVNLAYDRHQRLLTVGRLLANFMADAQSIKIHQYEADLNHNVKRTIQL